MKTTNQLIDIARAGGGIRIDASTKTTDQLIQIARAGKGCVVFDFVK